MKEDKMKEEKMKEDKMKEDKEKKEKGERDNEGKRQQAKILLIPYILWSHLWKGETFPKNHKNKHKQKDQKEQCTLIQ